MSTASPRFPHERVLAFLLAAGVLFLLPALLAQVPLWQADRIVKIYALAGTATFIAASFWLLLFRGGETRSSWFADAVACIAVFAPLGVLILLPAQEGKGFPALARPMAPHAILLIIIASGIALLFVVLRLRKIGWLLIGGLAGVIVAGAFAHLRLARATARIPLMSVVRTNTSLYPLRITFYENAFKKLASRGGALARLADGLLLVTADGDFYRIDRPKVDSPLVVHRSPFHSPMNRTAFATDTSRNGLDVGIRRFRTASMLVQETGENLRIFLTYHVWNPIERCTTMRLSSIEGKTTELFASASPQWKTWFETTPCLKLEREQEIYFGGISAGGRIVQLSDHELLFSIGDHEFEGVDTEPIAQVAEKTYGKIILLDLTNGQWRIYSLGQRNPQGLYVDAAGRVWETEHGPQGGDELNLIKDGRNYGWPLVSYGVDYGTHSWPINKTNGRHPDFEGPRFAWVPSIATANLTGVSKGLFELWRGDLMVGALNGKAIWRVRIVGDDRVTVTEQIPLTHRIRDIIEDQDGRLVVWTDEGALGVIEPESQPSTPASLFAWRCSACHAIGDGSQHRLGPDLHGVVGRRIGKARGFLYSQALQDKGGAWTTVNLDTFLTDPQHFAPGTAMAAPGLSDPKEREKIIEYLGSLGREN